MINLKVISGTIFMFLGSIGMLLVLFYSSSAVTPGYLVLGALGFGVLFMYGLNKALGSYYNALRDFQINN